MSFTPCPSHSHALCADENKKLGRGGQADVCIGKWKGSTVAVKRVRENTQAVRREVRALTRVRHPNVVRLYGACMDPPTPCLVMAYAEGGTLQEAIDAGRVDSNSEHLRVLVGIARGMEVVHAHKLIHLDLKPGVVMSPKRPPRLKALSAVPLPL